ncbi:hypothetical protein BaRGS_00035354 [Batillaria attramentaria]|uniref:Uncharacterized protein n=1 Tax=Batillaria attramentaria TaxID=370345 RepID=A0ABD0JEZ7_9CAEN
MAPGSRATADMFMCTASVPSVIMLTIWLLPTVQYRRSAARSRVKPSEQDHGTIQSSDGGDLSIHVRFHHVEGSTEPALFQPIHPPETRTVNGQKVYG